jgi:uncharacterized membrane protein
METRANRSTLIRDVLRWIAAAGFIAAGANHFIAPKFYREIVPPGFGDPSTMVAISGVAEIAGGLGLLIKPLRRSAGWGLMALLIAVFPANIYMAVSPRRGGMHISPWLLWLRLPLQVVFVAWIWVAAIAKPERSNSIS